LSRHARPWSFDRLGFQLLLLEASYSRGGLWGRTGGREGEVGRVGGAGAVRGRGVEGFGEGWEGGLVRAERMAEAGGRGRRGSCAWWGRRCVVIGGGVGVLVHGC